MNPFGDGVDTDAADIELLAAIRGGSRQALEELVTRHQGWIYNIALRMVYHAQDAEDVTQEVLIKVVTRLSTWAIFGVSDAVGAELMEISRDNFRQKLSRARRDLHNFMNDQCGLINTANPCRCAKKTQAFMKAGYIVPAI
jgi:DNA-directed RNA polymerase specialized sigma24 family protein